MKLLAPLPDAPDPDVDGHDEYYAWVNGATIAEFREWKRTDVLTLSLRLRWWWRRTLRVLR
ncbi:hypothetical protein ACIPJ2_11055 [Curtobacterium sp. NPDC090217]|uniref:hypothetical protein n=1 Tax=unclassified Curtobacterium TaxID=257496 RepID=UPI003814F83A